MAKKISDAAILAQLPAAAAREEAARDAGARAVSATYHRASKRLILELSNGVLVGIPVHDFAALRELSSAELAQVKVAPGGAGLIWNDDVDLSVPGILAASLGTAIGMRILGRAGGLVKSSAKRNAARKNGAKGGRPRKVAPGVRARKVG